METDIRNRQWSWTMDMDFRIKDKFLLFSGLTSCSIVTVPCLHSETILTSNFIFMQKIQYIQILSVCCYWMSRRLTEWPAHTIVLMFHRIFRIQRLLGTQYSQSDQRFTDSKGPAANQSLEGQKSITQQRAGSTLASRGLAVHQAAEAGRTSGSKELVIHCVAEGKDIRQLRAGSTTENGRTAEADRTVDGLAGYQAAKNRQDFGQQRTSRNQTWDQQVAGVFRPAEHLKIRSHVILTQDIGYPNVL